MVRVGQLAALDSELPAAVERLSDVRLQLWNSQKLQNYMRVQIARLPILRPNMCRLRTPQMHS
jgi:hypothetical protein